MLGIIKDYKKSEREIKRVTKECDKIEESGKAEQSGIYEKYREKMRTLEDKRSAHLRKIENRINSTRNKSQAEIEELHKAINKVECIAYFLSVDLNKDLTIKNTEIKAGRDRHIESAGYIFDDLMLKIKAFIAENRKPKNKYSLVAFGKSVFSEPVIKFPYEYGTPTIE